MEVRDGARSARRRTIEAVEQERRSSAADGCNRWRTGGRLPPPSVAAPFLWTCVIVEVKWRCEEGGEGGDRWCQRLARKRGSVGGRKAERKRGGEEGRARGRIRREGKRQAKRRRALDGGERRSSDKRLGWDEAAASDSTRFALIVVAAGERHVAGFLSLRLRERRAPLVARTWPGRSGGVGSGRASASGADPLHRC